MFVLRKLMPATDEYDFNIHVMDFQPGQYLYIKEIHYNQHGLLLLQGQGIYRWVQAGKEGTKSSHSLLLRVTFDSKENICCCTVPAGPPPH